MPTLQIRKKEKTQMKNFVVRIDEHFKDKDSFATSELLLIHCMSFQGTQEEKHMVAHLALEASFIGLGGKAIMMMPTKTRILEWIEANAGVHPYYEEVS
jgi:hypothetical protein